MKIRQSNRRGGGVSSGDSALAMRVREVEGAPVVTVRVVATGGARGEDIPGLGLVTGRMLSEGSQRRSWRRIAEDAEALGMAVASSASFEGHGVTVDALADDWEQALEWAAELMLEPAFPEERCRWVLRQTAAELESLADQPEVVCSWAFQEQLYSPHPLARRLQGDPQDLERIRPEDCRRFHHRCLEAGVTVVVAGHVPAGDVEKAVERYFGALAVPRKPLPEPVAPVGLPEPRRLVRIPPGDQAHLLMGHLTVPRRHVDGPALRVLAVILGAGSGLGGRIPSRIREKEGLAYVAQTHTVAGAGLDPGRFAIYVGTSPATVERAEAAAREELDRLLEKGVTSQEVEEARSYLLGREPFRRETARQWADLAAQAALVGLPLEDADARRAALERPSRDEVAAALGRHLVVERRPQRWVDEREAGEPAVGGHDHPALHGFGDGGSHRLVGQAGELAEHALVELGAEHRSEAQRVAGGGRQPVDQARRHLGRR
ncbi:MAG: insulinase family protein, partial [Acidobacteria bacterium]|nr:insulinase family protein [Acidobacteriota bacterium]